MCKSKNSTASQVKSGDTICGYCLKRVNELKENRLTFFELEHTNTGARHIHIASKDRENTFGVAFKTVPTDSTGVAHILEHTVLCGSKKFPVRDPFFSMLKRSLDTFMNAFTSSDWTMYPFSTQNKKDYYNLMEVYLDATFFPILNDLSFKQEGHRLEAQTDKLIYKGIVYNEMKGAMSSPSQVMVRSILNALYPETTYSFNSGGDPAIIPDLTHDQLLTFHKRHYHPSNSFFYTYGDLPLEDHLEFIHEKVLKYFDRIDPKTKVPAQPRWKEPKSVSYNYPLGKDEEVKKKYQFCIAWLTADIKDSFEILALTLLEKILLGNSASPLRKALIDSGIGAALCDGAGFDADNRDTMFVCGLKDVEKGSSPAIEKIIFDTLKDLVKNKVDNSLIESAIHQIEFERKEVTNTPFPYGIKLLLTLSSTWFHEGDPISPLAFDADLARLRKELSKGPFFENRIERYFLENSHRVLLILEPDQLMEEKESNRVEKELNNLKTRMSESDIEKIESDAKALLLLQKSSEDLTILPTLELEDIPSDIQRVYEAARFQNEPFSCYDQPTMGISYFSLAAGAGSLPKRLMPYVPFFCSTFSSIGTKDHDYTEMAKLIDAYTGGVGLSSIVNTSFDPKGACMPIISFFGKCLVRNQAKMFEIIKELLSRFDSSNLTRLKNLLLEYRAGLESSVVQNGHGYAISLASRNFSISSTLSESWNGIHRLKTVKELATDLSDEKLCSIADNLQKIAKCLINQNNIKIALVGEESTLNDGISYAKSIQQAIEKGGGPLQPEDTFPPPDIDAGDKIPFEGWSTSSAVSFVAKSFQTVRMDHEDAPVLTVINKILKSMYLHTEIREKGGAYGGFATYNPENGIFSFASYRDPHIFSTLKVFDGVPAFIKSGKYNDEDIKEAILQVASDIDKPDTPGTAARKAFFRKIVSLSDEARSRYKSQVLSTTKDRVMEVAEKYFDNDDSGHGVAVISGEDLLKNANKKLKDRPLELFTI